MADTITMAIEKSGYCLTDRATWLATEDKSNFDIICEGDSNLKNQYGVIAVSPENILIQILTVQTHLLSGFAPKKHKKLSTILALTNTANNYSLQTQK